MRTRTSSRRSPQQRAVAAQEAGIFDWEITPVTKEDGTVVTKDDGPRAGTTKEKLAQLQPVFKPEGGTVTAGNACPLNDGAAAVVVMSRTRGRRSSASRRSPASSPRPCPATTPRSWASAPIEAIGKVLDAAGMKIGDIDFVELNEAFAAQVLPIMREVGITNDQINPHGGAIALGHPFGMTGARIMTTLINDLRTEDKQFGIETMCAAGGMGMAMIIERLS